MCWLFTMAFLLLCVDRCVFVTEEADVEDLSKLSVNTTAHSEVLKEIIAHQHLTV